MGQAAASSGKWGDLQVRLLSAAALTVVGLGALLIGGVWTKLQFIGSSAKLVKVK